MKFFLTCCILYLLTTIQSHPADDYYFNNKREITEVINKITNNSGLSQEKKGAPSNSSGQSQLA